MGVVPQEIALYEELSGRENLEFWGRMAGLTSRDAHRRADELLAALSLADRARDPVKKYSGGMRRRINLGCALLHRPRLLLLDEPTVGIDPQARLNILEFIRGLVQGGTAILYTTHYLEEAETLCNRIGIIDHGRVLAEGTLPELQRRIGEARLFVMEGRFDGVAPDTWPGFHDQFRVIQQSERQLVVSALGERDPAECLKQLLALPVQLENVTLKRPSLNDVFLQLTGRELREWPCCARFSPRICAAPGATPCPGSFRSACPSSSRPWSAWPSARRRPAAASGASSSAWWTRTTRR